MQELGSELGLPQFSPVAVELGSPPFQLLSHDDMHDLHRDLSTFPALALIVAAVLRSSSMLLFVVQRACGQFLC